MSYAPLWILELSALLSQIEQVIFTLSSKQSEWHEPDKHFCHRVFKCVAACVAVRCSVLQRVPACCCVLRCVAECCCALQCVAVCVAVWHEPDKHSCHRTLSQELLPLCVAVCYCALYVLQCAAVCCSAVQCVAVCVAVWHEPEKHSCHSMLTQALLPLCVAVRFSASSALQCVAVRCSVCRTVQCVAVCVAAWHEPDKHSRHPLSPLCVAVCYSMLHCVAVCCSSLQCVTVSVAVCCSALIKGRPLP